MQIDESEIRELANLIRCSIYYGYNTNEVTVSLAHKLIKDDELEELDLNNLGQSLLKCKS